MSALFLWKAGDVRLGASVIGGFVAAIAVFGSLGFLLLKALSHMRGQTGGALRYGLASIRRRATSSVVQAVALGLGLMALLALTLIRDDLLQNWRTSLPPDAPIIFWSIYRKTSWGRWQRFFNEHHLARPPVFPMIRGRLTAINGKAIAAAEYFRYPSKTAGRARIQPVVGRGDAKRQPDCQGPLVEKRG